MEYSIGHGGNENSRKILDALIQITMIVLSEVKNLPEYTKEENSKSNINKFINEL